MKLILWSKEHARKVFLSIINYDTAIQKKEKVPEKKEFDELQVKKKEPENLFQKKDATKRKTKYIDFRGNNYNTTRPQDTSQDLLKQDSNNPYESAAKGKYFWLNFLELEDTKDEFKDTGNGFHKFLKKSDNVGNQMLIVEDEEMPNVKSIKISKMKLTLKDAVQRQTFELAVDTKPKSKF